MQRRAKDPQVSVVIPTYNRRKDLVRAVRSALAQPETLEVLVCDDGSSDGSQQAVLALKNRKVRWVEGPRAGRPAVPRNRGIRQARGAWVAFLDSDDWFKPGKLKAQLAALAASGASACCTNALCMQGGRSKGALLEGLPSQLAFMSLMNVNQVVCSSMLVARPLLLESGGFPESKRLTALEDWSLWLRLAARGPIVCLKESWVHYTDAPKQSLRGQAPDSFANQQIRVLVSLLAWCLARPQRIPLVPAVLLALAKAPARWARNRMRLALKRLIGK
jgi:teichuronic acid biosynthesis glycosyltransferase TuaG